jgi:hypothetical protein
MRIVSAPPPKIESTFNSLAFDSRGRIAKFVVFIMFLEINLYYAYVLSVNYLFPGHKALMYA